MEKKTYRIVCSTDPYHASRSYGFELNASRTRGLKTMDEGLSLREAQKRLLEYFCEDAGRRFPNWGIACAWKEGEDFYAYPTRKDGTRAYSNDILLYEIEEQGTDEGR